MHCQAKAPAQAPAPAQASSVKVQRFRARVFTGDRHGAGTNAKIFLQLVDSTGKSSVETPLDKIYFRDLQRGQSETYDVLDTGLAKPDEIAYITLLRKHTPFPDDSWFLDKIELEDTVKKTTYIYPAHRWISENEVKYRLNEYDAILPQFDKQREARDKEVEAKRKAYEFKITVKDGPKQLNKLPMYENYSEVYMDNIEDDQVKMRSDPNYKEFLDGQPWKNLNELGNIFPKNSVLPVPDLSIKHWKEDRWFGLQRVQGMNPVLITLCTKIPEKFDVKASEVEKSMEGVTLCDALKNNKIFIVDLEIMDGVPSNKVSDMVAPMGLFYLNKKDELMPIAIQLYQKKSPSNPVFYPTDHPNVWLLAKMFFNMGEAQQHQSCTHLGFTHMVIESMCVAANRQLSPSHPIFRLMAPHFLYMLPLNVGGINKLIMEGGFFDKFMTMGRVGALAIIGKTFKKWRFNEDGNFVKQLEKRGVMDSKILPYYPYRDDGVPLYKLIREYVSKVVKFFYDTNEKLVGDYELQNWVKEMATPLESGCGFLGMPEKLTSVEDLVEICTAVISICSMGHAAANFQQYNAYAMIANYPVVLPVLPPKTKDPITEEQLVKYLPSKAVSLFTMVFTRVLSTMSTKCLGEFEVQYLYNPEVVKITDDFRKKLAELSLETKKKNQMRPFQYEWLDPEVVPNAISI